MHFDFAPSNCGWRPPFMAIAALAVCLSGCVTEERSTNVSRRDIAVAPASTPVRLCSVQELRTALAARESGYDYVLPCS